MSAILALVRANLRRFANDRTNVFFVIALPMLIVFALSAAIVRSQTMCRT